MEQRAVHRRAALHNEWCRQQRVAFRYQRIEGFKQLVKFALVFMYFSASHPQGIDPLMQHQ